MRTLTDVFAPGSPTLPEGLRTLVVSPERELEPGMTVRAAFTFANHGGAPATGVRVRFNIPDGLVYLVGSGTFEGELLDDEQGNSPLLARGGAAIGDVAPGQERRIEIAYSVAGAIENGSTIELQAAVASFEVPPVGSNVVRLVARSKPQLRNAMTSIAVEARPEPVPGGEAQITVRVHNAGESSAHDVVVVAPIPAHTSYVANSARVNGRELERDLGTSFDYAYAPTIAPTLAASATVTLVYRVRVDGALDDGTEIVATARVASQETPAFDLAAGSLNVVSEPDFSTDATSFEIEPAHGVRPGERVAFHLVARNTGTSAAARLTASLELPDALLFVRGATRIDGRPVRERKKEVTTFDLGRIGVDESVELHGEAVIATPLPDGQDLPVVLALAWEPQRCAGAGGRRFERTVTVHSEPRLVARRNAIARCGPAVVRPADEIEATILLANDGSAAVTDAVLRVRVDAGLEEVRVFERSTRVPFDADVADLGVIEPAAQRQFSLRARVRTPYADRAEVRIGASLHSRELGETSLGEANWRIDSHPAFSAQNSRLELAGDAVLRPNQLADVYVRLTNVGSDVAHNVRLRLYVSPEARLESVDGATRERSMIAFGEIAPGGSVEARLGLRLLRGLAKAHPVTVDAVLSADAMLPIPLDGLVIATTAEPDFSVATLHAQPADVVDAGETIEWTLYLRNGGDGPARRVAVRAAQPDALIYVPNSTTINDIPVRDVGALSSLACERGIVLNDVDPGVEVTLRFRDVVHNGLSAGETIARTVTMSYDGQHEDVVISDELKVRAVPAFANAIPGLPFGVDGMLGPSLADGRRALSAERFIELPQATPVGGDALTLASGIMRRLPAPDAAYEISAALMPDTLRGRTVGMVVGFDQDRLKRTLRFLDEASFGGLVSHLFALRAMLPDAIGDTPSGSLSSLRETLKETLDRLFIKLRLPNYVVAPRDVETPSSRATVERFLLDAACAHGSPADPPGAVRVFTGGYDAQLIEEGVQQLGEAPLATACPWMVLGALLPDGEPAMVAYRQAFAAAFGALADAEPTEFLDALQRTHDPALDLALRGVRQTLADNA